MALAEKFKKEIEDERKLREESERKLKSIHAESHGRERNALSNQLETELNKKVEELKHRDEVLQQRENERNKLAKELNQLRQENDQERQERLRTSDKHSNLSQEVVTKNILIKSMEKKIEEMVRAQANEVKDANDEVARLRSQLNDRESRVSDYKQRDDNTQNIVTLALE